MNQADGSAVSVQLQARGSGVPADNMLSAVATFASVSGEPRTASLQASLALKCISASQQGVVDKHAQEALSVALPWLVGASCTLPDQLALGCWIYWLSRAHAAACSLPSKQWQGLEATTFATALYLASW